MKKYLLVLAMVFTLGAVITGCGEKKDPEATVEEEAEAEATETPEAELPQTEQVEAPSFDEIDLEKIVKLPKYKGMELEKTVVEVTDADVEAKLASDLQAFPEADTDGVVDDGDTVDIDYEGKVDDVAFEGGTAQGQTLLIGSGQFIPGFEEALVGAKKGETKDIEVTFPDGYSPELAGKDAVFTVTINEITTTPEEMTDEWVAANSDFKTVKEYKADAKKTLEESNDQMAEQDLMAQSWDKLMTESEVSEYPEEIVDYGKKLYAQNIQTYADYSGQTLEEYLESQGITSEQYEEQAASAGQDIAKQLLVMQAVIQEEGVKKGDAAYKEGLKQIEEESGLTEADLLEQYGEANIEQNIWVRYVQRLIVDEAKIVEVTPAPMPEVSEGELPEEHSADDGHDH